MINESNESDRSPVEDKLARAMKSQAEKFEPSPDAFQKLEAAVDQQNRTVPNSLLGRPLAIAAATVAVVGLGTFAIFQQPKVEVTAGSGPGRTVSSAGQEAEGSATAQADASDASNAAEPSEGNETEVEEQEPSTEPAIEEEQISDEPDKLDSEDDPPSDDQLREEIAGQASYPVRSDLSDAIQDFLHLIDSNGTEFDVSAMDRRMLPEGPSVLVPVTSGDQEIAELSVVPVPNGFTVADTYSTSDLTIDDIDTSNAAEGTITVSGTGSGFEGAVSIELFAVGDGRLLASETATAGSFGEAKPFTVEVPVHTTERAIVVLRSLEPTEYDPNFVTATVSYEVPFERETFVVAKIPPGDPDGGLVLRQGPGNYERITVLEPGAVVVRQADFAPYQAGSELWWFIGSDGQQGWVNSGFLASSTEPTAQQQSTADDVAFRIRDGNYGAIPFARRVAVGYVNAPTQVLGSELVTAEGWTEARSFEDETVNESFDGSLEDFLGFNFLVEGSTGEGSESGRKPLLDENLYFGGLTPRVSEVEWPDGSRYRVHVYYEPTRGGIQVIGLVSEPIS